MRREWLLALALAAGSLFPAAHAQSPPSAQGLGGKGGGAGGEPSAQAAPQASPGDIDGETLFATSCGWCHQQGGRAAGRGPKLAGIEKSDEFIINRVKHGKPGAMPAFGRAFSDGQVIAILAYIRSLDDSGAAGQEGKDAKPPDAAH
jgi:mono/diheme cytochrome c family protein